MNNNATVAELREKLLGCRQGTAAVVYPPELRERAMRYARRRRQQGLTPEQIGSELGVHPATVVRWTRGLPRAQASPSLVPVVLRQEPAAAPAGIALDLELSDGTHVRVSGLGSAELLSALESLRRAR